MIVAIHQPNFFPWYPFFQKMEEADIFVILTQCQFEKNGYQNRFQADGRWHTMKINRGMEPIAVKKYIDPVGDWLRIKEKFPQLCEFDGCISTWMAETNIEIIRRIARKLRIHTKIVLDYPTELTGTDRLADICRHFGATEYLSGSSGAQYMDLEKFGDIKVRFQSGQMREPIVKFL